MRKPLLWPLPVRTHPKEVLRILHTDVCHPCVYTHSHTSLHEGMGCILRNASLDDFLTVWTSECI